MKKNFYLKRLFLLPLAGLALVITYFAKLHPEATEAIYSRSIYPKLMAVVGWLPSFVGFSVAEWLVVGFFAGCLGVLGYYLIQLIKGRERRLLVIYRLVTAALAIFSVVYFVFTLVCGPNYYRQTFAQQANYDLSAVSLQELTAVTEELAGELAVAKAAVISSDSPRTFQVYAKKSVAAMSRLKKDYPALRKIDFRPPKPVLLSTVMSYGNTTGIFIPFTMEANINIDVPFYTIPATMCHELSHQAGFMREDEANFLAYLACKDSSDPLQRYSGLSLAFDYTISALRRSDAEKAQTIIEQLPEPIQQDRRDSQAYWQQHNGFFSEVSTSMNDLYLKANSQTAGIASYNQMVMLVVGEWRQRQTAVQPE